MNPEHASVTEIRLEILTGGSPEGLASLMQRLDPETSEGDALDLLDEAVRNGMENESGVSLAWHRVGILSDAWMVQKMREADRQLRGTRNRADNPFFSGIARVRDPEQLREAAKVPIGAAWKVIAANRNAPADIVEHALLKKGTNVRKAVLENITELPVALFERLVEKADKHERRRLAAFAESDEAWDSVAYEIEGSALGDFVDAACRAPTPAQQVERLNQVLAGAATMKGVYLAGALDRVRNTHDIEIRVWGSK